MKLYYSGYSPFARKVAVIADVLGLSPRIEKIPAKGDVLARDKAFRQLNPSGQIPVLVTDEGMILYDSKVICAYLNVQSDGDVMGVGDDLWRNQRDAALGDTLAEAALQYRYEIALRPPEYRWDAWRVAWENKIEDCLGALEQQVPSFGERLDIGTISIFCALVYIDWRLADIGWTSCHPCLRAWFGTFASRPVIGLSAPA